MDHRRAGTPKSLIIYKVYWRGMCLFSLRVPRWQNFFSGNPNMLESLSTTPLINKRKWREYAINEVSTEDGIYLWEDIQR